MIGISHSGSLSKVERFIEKMRTETLFDALERFGQMGVAALAQATPKDSGIAAGSWYYVIDKQPGERLTISWKNSDRTPSGTPIVIMLQYGHRTGTGGWVPGRDFVNPALEPVFKQAIETVWKAVQS